MAAKMVKVQDGIRWYNPLEMERRPFLWEDGVHSVKKTEYFGIGIAFVTGCGQMFTFAVMPGSQVLEAGIKLPKVNCKECLEWLSM